MLRARSALFAVLFHLNLAVILIVMLPMLVMPKRMMFVMGNLWARTSLWLLWTVCGTKVEIRGAHRIPSGGFIIAPKHQSALETFALLPLFSGYTFVLKRELLSLPLFGWYLRKADQIAIDRSKGPAALAAVVARAKAALAAGRPLFLFPEGTRRPVGAAPDYKPGIARVYGATGVPCLPVAVNTGLFWPRRGFLRRPGTVVLECLEPIPPGLDRPTFIRVLKERIEPATDRLVAAALAADPTLVRAIPSATEQPASTT
jgi:1-acyl-sn-glycerol-3-phosphate acyltransferase